MLSHVYKYITAIASIAIVAGTSYWIYATRTKLHQTPIVLMTDFGSIDGAVSAMKGVIYSVDQQLTVTDLTHEIKPFNIHDGAYRLFQVLQYYPKGTVFVCVIDPGVGHTRKSIVAKTGNDYYFVGPDNGLLTYIAQEYGITAIRQIDESANRLPNSYDSHTFYGRDIFAYTAARLSAGLISFDQVGSLVTSPVVTFPIHPAQQISSSCIQGEVVILDGIYGNIWTNVYSNLLSDLDIKPGRSYHVKLWRKNSILFQDNVRFDKTFSNVAINKPIMYINSLGAVAIALNQGNFAQKYNISPGDRLQISID